MSDALKSLSTADLEALQAGDMSKVSTSHVEAQNLTLRMNNRRFARLTNAHSKKLANHKHSLALHFMHRNFLKIHPSLRVTPAMEAGLSNHVWEWAEVLASAI